MCSVLARYWLLVVPKARREVSRWRTRAAEIPDPTLRRVAMATLTEKALNCEGAAVFAVFAPRARRAATIRALVGFQVIFDYLDSVNECEAPDQLGDGEQLHKALLAALEPEARQPNYYMLHPQVDDGGYLQGAVAVCRENLAQLPGGPASRPVALRAAARCREGQAQTHAAIGAGTERLAEWAARQDRAAGHLWWEMAAAGISSVGVLALIGTSADREASARESRDLDRAYFPGFCALSTLLDSLIDLGEDVETSNLNTIAMYGSSELAAERLGAMVRESAARARTLRDGRTHLAVLAGIAGFYLSAPEAETAFAEPIKASVVSALSPMATPVVATMRMRRALRGKTPTR